MKQNDTDIQPESLAKQNTMSDMKEATARIKINKLLEAAGWRFFKDGNAPANICLEPTVTIIPSDLKSLGNDFENTERGFIDFLLLDSNGFPLIILEAKAENKNPLTGKEQARRYARSLDCRFIILSNGNLHYFWDLQRGNPYVITIFPSPDSVVGFKQIVPNTQRLVQDHVESDYIVLTQHPTYKTDTGWKNEDERPTYKHVNKLRFLRPYQLKAVHQLQIAIKEGKDRFLFEMATGTGKTLTAIAVVKLFLSTGNVRRVLFLVDRLELEDQAKKAFSSLLSIDFSTVIYKENRNDWRCAEIVITTIQSLLFNNKYQQLFSPTDFDLVISDEAHRSIGGNARAVFEYFVGYKLGLTATPRDYLRNFNIDRLGISDPRATERRLLLDTYRTFGCESGQPTFRYSLLDGVRDGYLVNPIVVDARTEITSKLLSDRGFVVFCADDTGDDQCETYKQREFERRFFSEATNQLFCKIFLENALKDPISKEIGKSIVFAVSQNHASKLAQIFNMMAHRMFPYKYQSDFAVQVTSSVPDAQRFTANFANNNLLGSGNFISSYKTSKARICVTVGMMTTGYDCTDILNIGLFRPIFSPTDFIQIKGRGTRRHNFLNELFDDDIQIAIVKAEKKNFKLFDFFANCDYFETGFNYDETLELPRQAERRSEVKMDNEIIVEKGVYEHLGTDILSSIEEQNVGLDGMKIDRKFFERFQKTVCNDPVVVEGIKAGRWDRVIDYVNSEIFDRPEDYYNLNKLRKATAVDRRITLREILENIFGIIPYFKSKDELLEEEFAKFVTDYIPQSPSAIPAIKHYFKAYVTNDQIRKIIDQRQFVDLATNSIFSTRDFRAVPPKYRTLVPEYIKDYISLNQFTT